MKDRMLQGSVHKTLIGMSAPISIGMLSTFLFQLVDTYFVGKLGSSELAALSFSSTAFFLVLSIFMGLSVGTSSLVAKANGEKKTKKANNYATMSLISGFLISLAIGIVGVLNIGFLFTLLGSDEAVLPFISQYMTITFLTMPLLTFGLIGSGILRASGKTKYPELIFGIAGVINLVFDYLLIFGIGFFPELKIQGAALATATSWLFISLGMLYMLSKEKLITLKITKAKKTIKKLFSQSMPAIGSQLLSPVVITFVIFLLAKTSSSAVAGYGVASRIQSLVMVGIYAVGVALTPFIAQNFGAKRNLRVDEAIRFAGKSSTYLGLLAFLVLIFIAGPLAKIFTSDPEIIHVVKIYFYVISISYAGLGLINVTTSIFNGLQLPKEAFKIILIKTFILTIPFVFIGSLFGLIGIFIAISLSNIIGAIYASVIMRKHIKQTKSSLFGVDILADYKSDMKKIFKNS